MSSRNEPAMSAKILNKAGWMLSDQTGRVKSFKLRAGRICVHVGMLLATCKWRGFRTVLACSGLGESLVNTKSAAGQIRGQPSQVSQSWSTRSD
ncbi:hypothetical protein HanXRQr2_Chr06g0275861 [Helianthus annuus]|uniref:Uncharacterized protein n=1 Tax=Helianthus annuus TaxID=4232 RepID=A0A251UL04_HELAN|nr:hypothetical protein HanXRQr2_Chr06g0275861 [Helianthus annuus]KAJ0916862.1 hypothetical protein HanPSC8_Chr06g0266701 [Helianthus annuus]